MKGSVSSETADRFFTKPDLSFKIKNVGYAKTYKVVLKEGI